MFLFKLCYALYFTSYFLNNSASYLTLLNHFFWLLQSHLFLFFQICTFLLLIFDEPAPNLFLINIGNIVDPDGNKVTESESVRSDLEKTVSFPSRRVSGGTMDNDSSAMDQTVRQADLLGCSFGRDRSGTMVPCNRCYYFYHPQCVGFSMVSISFLRFSLFSSIFIAREKARA